GALRQPQDDNVEGDLSTYRHSSKRDAKHKRVQRVVSMYAFQISRRRILHPSQIAAGGDAALFDCQVGGKANGGQNQNCNRGGAEQSKLGLEERDPAKLLRDYRNEWIVEQV